MSASRNLYSGYSGYPGKSGYSGYSGISGWSGKIDYCESINHSIIPHDKSFDFITWFQNKSAGTVVSVPQTYFDVKLTIRVSSDQRIDDTFTRNIIHGFNQYCQVNKSAPIPSVSRSRMIQISLTVKGTEIERFIDDLEKATVHLNFESVYLNNYTDKQGLPREIKKKEWKMMPKAFKKHILNRDWKIK